MAGMPVAVDEARHHHLPPGVDHLARVEPGPDLLRRPDGDDAIADDRDSAVIEHPSRGVHRDDGATGDEDVGGLLAGGPCGGAANDYDGTESNDDAMLGHGKS